MMMNRQVQVLYGPECESVDYARMLAHWAKVELLKEKIKERMEAKYGKQIEKMADLVVEVIAERARNSEQIEHKEDELEDLFYGLGGEE